jgi:hypothetical protein
VACVGGAGDAAGAAATGAATLTSAALVPDAEVVDWDAPRPVAEEAAATLVLAAVAASAASVRWSAAMTAESRVRVRVLAAFWLVAATDALVVAALVVMGIVELTKALASPAPIRAIEVTTMDGRIRRRARERPSARAPLARLAAIR